MPLDDLTGTWVDNQGHGRLVTACACDAGHDVWHVTFTDATFGHGRSERHYDGDTIRIWWTLTPTPRLTVAR